MLRAMLNMPKTRSLGGADFLEVGTGQLFWEAAD